MDLLAPYPFDFLIGSVHWVGGWSIDASDVMDEFERRGIDRAWEDYFDLVTDLARRGVVDVLAHVDVCKKFGYRPEVGADPPLRKGHTGGCCVRHRRRGFESGSAATGPGGLPVADFSQDVSQRRGEGHAGQRWP